MDKECIPLCNTLNSLKGIETFESCCGHNKEPYRIFFVSKNSNIGLFILTRCINSRYWKFGHLWKIELTVGDTCFKNKYLPIHYYLHSGNIVGENAYLQANDLIENINYHLNHKNFKKLFKIK